jgi:diketogulonate reductase-like aldo/keto reductase
LNQSYKYRLVIETHPFNQQIETLAFLEEYGGQIEAWAPFAEGKHDILRTRGSTPSLRSTGRVLRAASCDGSCNVASP